MQLASCAWSGKATSMGEAVGMQAPSATIRDTLHPQQEPGASLHKAMIDDAFR